MVWTVEDIVVVLIAFSCLCAQGSLLNVAWGTMCSGRDETWTSHMKD